MKEQLLKTNSQDTARLAYEFAAMHPKHSMAKNLLLKARGALLNPPSCSMLELQLLLDLALRTPE